MIWSNNQLGAAYYNILTSELFVMDDTYDDGINFNITKTLYKQCQPRYVITLSGTSDAFLTAIEALVKSETSSELNRSSGTSSVGPMQVLLRVMRKREHGFDRCYHRVRCLKLESEPANANNVERLIFLQGLLNFKSIVMIHTLGLLLIYIDQHWSNIALDPSGRPSFVSLTSVTLLLAFYVVAREYNYVKPNVVERQIIAVEQGRHPLQEFLTTFVPNDTYSGDGKSLVKILTGPNASGKSTYLKQIALIVFMAHIGCYVPAKSATIGIVTHILTQIASVDSIALNTSMFLQDMRQINSALYASTPNSIVILDEFGNGTSEVSGLSLLAAVLNNFVERGIRCPHVFVATHMHRIMSMLPQSPIIEEQTFEFITNNDGSVAYLYRITTGHATRSFAHAAARSAGLNEHIVKRALESLQVKAFLQVYEKFKAGELPPRLPEAARQDMPARIIERLLKSENFDVEELKSLVRQATESLAVKK
ncbi:protein 5 [Lasius niger]|uniref:Protein 5 n=1 Tax=Lasius niger TaxID=67767 RepID=A0A0J7L836_LASNI|nr:protein 5 [Lasius niger]